MANISMDVSATEPVESTPAGTEPTKPLEEKAGSIWNAMTSNLLTRALATTKARKEAEDEPEAEGRPRLNEDQKGTFDEWMRRMYGDLRAIGERFNFDPQIDRAREEFNKEQLYHDWLEGTDSMDIAEWWVQTEGLNQATVENLSDECLSYIAHDRLYPIVKEWYDERERLAKAIHKKHGFEFAFQDDEGVVYQAGSSAGRFIPYPEFEIIRTMRRSADEKQGTMTLNHAESLGFEVERARKKTAK